MTSYFRDMPDAWVAKLRVVGDGDQVLGFLRLFRKWMADRGVETKETWGCKTYGDGYLYFYLSMAATYIDEDAKKRGLSFKRVMEEVMSMDVKPPSTCDFKGIEQRRQEILKRIRKDIEERRF